MQLSLTLNTDQHWYVASLCLWLTFALYMSSSSTSFLRQARMSLSFSRAKGAMSERSEQTFQVLRKQTTSLQNVNGRFQPESDVPEKVAMLSFNRREGRAVLMRSGDGCVSVEYAHLHSNVSCFMFVEDSHFGIS